MSTKTVGLWCKSYNPYDQSGAAVISVPSLVFFIHSEQTVQSICDTTVCQRWFKVFCAQGSQTFEEKKASCERQSIDLYDSSVGISLRGAGGGDGLSCQAEWQENHIIKSDEGLIL